MTTVNTLLKAKEDNIWTIVAKTTVYDAIDKMSDKNVGALLVVDGENLIGIFTERDYARKLILKGLSSKNTTVGEIMTAKVFYIAPDNTIQDCMVLMTSKRIRHLPVMDDGRLMGIITIGDVIKQIISDQEITIHQLENYISGSY